jgi:hypothetical protein
MATSWTETRAHSAEGATEVSPARQCWEAKGTICESRRDGIRFQSKSPAEAGLTETKNST